MRYGLVLVCLSGSLSSLMAEEPALPPDPQVLTAAERETQSRMVRRWLDTKLQAANQASSSAWAQIRSREEWEAFRREKLHALQNSLGIFPQPGRELRRQTTGTVQGNDYLVQNVVFESWPGWWVSANLYRPARPSEQMPGILICHSHHRPKEHVELQDMGATWAQAGCLVLIMDQLGHGERGQHPFRSSADYPVGFQVSRQDYYFRFDSAIRLQLLGDSLTGWMVRDLRRGVDLLLAEPGIDASRIILLGSVAGGGDPAAVAGALDERITAVVPFNFGGPQPETVFPLPGDAVRSFNYAGSGSWESTRNLARSAGDGFLPWVIVGGIAPRKLIYAHEFAWDGDRDPVWKRLQTIYGWYGEPGSLSAVHGYGNVRLSSSEASHCTHIGRQHREGIHQDFGRWFGIRVAAPENFQPHPADDLTCFTPAWLQQQQPRTLSELLPELADQRLAANRRQLRSLEPSTRRRRLRQQLERLLGSIQPQQYTAAEIAPGKFRLETGEGIVLPILLLKRAGVEKPPVIVLTGQGGKSASLQLRSREITTLMQQGWAVCLLDVRGVGETSGDSGRGRDSADTSRASTALMLGETLVGARLADLRTTLAWLRTRTDLDSQQLYLWGDSPATVNAAGQLIAVPHRIDGRPRPAEPLGQLLVLLAALYEEDIRGIYFHGGVVNFRQTLTSPFTCLPYDVVIPELLTVADLPDLAASLTCPVAYSGLVTEHNQPAAPEMVRQLYPTASGNRHYPQGMAVVDWFEHLRSGRQN